MTQDSTSYDKRFGFVAYGLLFLIILFSTYVHHLQPQILRVPDNGDPTAWHNPTLDQTILADGLTDDQRAPFLDEGVPLGTDLPAQFAADAGARATRGCDDGRSIASVMLCPSRATDAAFLFTRPH